MKETKKIISVLLCLCFIFPFYEIVNAAITYKDYTTWTMKDATLLTTLPNNSTNVNGVTYRTTGVQGMNVGTTFIYTAKIYTGDEKVDVVTIYRTRIDSNDTIVMECYDSPSATTPGACSTAGHANDLHVVTAYDTNYLLSATNNSAHAVARYLISGIKLYFTGYFKLVRSNGNSMGCGAMRQFKHADGYFYMIFKTGESFYYGKIPDTAPGGSSSNPTKVPVFKIATLDKRNAIFAKSSSSYGTYPNLESWVPQGFVYNPRESTIYTPYFEPPKGEIITTAIIMYYVGDIFTPTNMNYKTDKDILVLPSKTSFYLNISDYASECKTKTCGFEVESCGFRTGQDATTGDLKMYINANAAPEIYEGIYYLKYISGTGNKERVADPSTPVYTVRYNGNGGKDVGENNTDGYFEMEDTRHVYGITTNLRENYFVKSGYTFEGWYLTRQSDGKWLYMDNGDTRWYTKGKQPQGAYLALYENKRPVTYLSGVNGDIVTLYAQWKISEYSIRYDPNGGSGTTMTDQRIIYGQSTNIKKNTYTRSGYQFSGWIAFRRSDSSWIYKSKIDLNDKWIPEGESTNGYFLKAYTDGCSVAASSSVNNDLVIFYAAWTKVNSPSTPSNIKRGSNFNIGGKIVSDAGLYTVTVSVINSSNKTVMSTSDNPYGTSYDLSNLRYYIDFSTLEVGTYTYKVTATTVNASQVMTTITLIDTKFNVS